MPRTITVKGIGKVATPPDLVVLNMKLNTKDRNYEKAMALAANKIGMLNSALEKIGFEKQAIKTTNFEIRTDYEYRERANGKRVNVFTGYELQHNLKLEFDFDSTLLSQVLSVVGSSSVNPEIKVAFTVKDPNAINEELLRQATENAKRKAEILCSASDQKLGNLLSISYNWADINVYSNTDYELEEACCRTYSPSIDIQPDDIKVSDSASFVWEIED